MTTLPTLFLSHGGGPWPFMEDPHGVWKGMAVYLRGLDRSIGVRPAAVLAISGHWEAPLPTVNAGAHPPLLFDYYGFPPHTYRLAYPAPGDPALAGRIAGLLRAAGIASGEDAARGFDHGVFVPFTLVYPEADVPIVQLSLRRDLDPAAHLAIGRALAPLRDAGVLIVGSGMSYHNLRDFGSPAPRPIVASARFDAWLAEAVEARSAARDAALTAWRAAPDALACHPDGGAHLLPLMVAAGAAAGDPGRRTYGDRIMGKSVSAFQFG